MTWRTDFFPKPLIRMCVTQYDRLIATLEKQPQMQVIAVSEATKTDIVNLTAIASDRVHVVYEALPEEARVVPSEDRAERGFGALGIAPTVSTGGGYDRTAQKLRPNH